MPTCDIIFFVSDLLSIGIIWFLFRVFHIMPGGLILVFVQNALDPSSESYSNRRENIREVKTTL